ncbi:hypothetical protein QIS99_17200 [Streptomyces sp. B-S-A8]|uniref:HEAT repeat domain-containing protein n=1 Tax=Streptomyces solicavernae TaxID=3043614 RepID=A0ABT6RVZ5_9ACTN|nr:hypothetical protein [Streptomyces sp. B-S-A8]MDI3387923.1 hypothetical protein [Streptomyces sp. B-S-A8]
MATPAAPQPRRPRQPSSPGPQPLTPGWLSAHFDPLPFPARTSALARYARSLTPAAYAALHHTLDAGTDHERHTALFLAVARRDLPAVATALDDPALRRRALSAAIRLPVPEPALEKQALSPARAVRHDTYRVLKRSRRHTLAAALLPRAHAQYGDDDAGRLLTACPAATVDTWLPRLDPPLGVLRTLARTAPVAVARLVADRYSGIRPHERHARSAFDRRYRALACLAARRDPDAGLVLVHAAPHLLEGEATLSVLRRPTAVLEALRARAPLQAPNRQERHCGCTPRPELSLPPGSLPRAVRTALLQLPHEDLADLAEHGTADARRSGVRQRHEVAPDALLMLLPPAERRRAVTRRAADHRNGLDAVSVTALAALTPDDRAEGDQPAHRAGQLSRTDALRRLAACADTLQNACRPEPGPGYGQVHEADTCWADTCWADTCWADTAQQTGEVIDGLVDALRAVGLHGRAEPLLRGALLSTVLRRCPYQPERWDRLLRSIEAREAPLPPSAELDDPDAWPARSALPGPLPTPDPAQVVEPALAAVRDLRARGTRSSARLACAVVRTCGERSSWSPEWRAELDALRRHQDAETAAEAMLRGPDAT